ncbi:hypothetical protein LUCX_94 [Xanthomonas phage vB_XciM_LucasX]|nr:hypothetical protein LUCX_94 [Xanthomonas phage vB_XciM_LucasX]
MSNENNPTSQDESFVENDIPLPHEVAPVAPVAEQTPVVESIIDPMVSGTDEAACFEVDETLDAQAAAEAAINQIDEEDGYAVFVRRGVNPHAEMSFDPSRPLDPRRPWRPGEHLSVVPCTAEEFNHLVQNVARLDPTGSKTGAQWTQAVYQGQEVMPRGNALAGAVTRETSLWRQGVTTGGEGTMDLMAGRPRFGEQNQHKALVGDEAVQYMQAMLGTGHVTRVPLWHSGIWINLKAPSEQQLLELERRISNEKISLGRATNGLIFSNTMVFHNSFLFNFALGLVFDCSISAFTTETLKRKILLTDLPTLLWGLLCTIYPNGYKYHRPCVNDPSKCTHVAEAILDIIKLCWTDNTALTEAQRKHMVRKTAKFTDLELSNYVSQHSYNSKATVTVRDVDGIKTTVQLRVPTLADYEQSGFNWVEGIVTGTDMAFGSQLGGEERNDYIMEQASATSLSQYAHWVERVNFNNGLTWVDDRQTMEKIIGQLTGDTRASESFLEGMRAFINDATISLIAIPSYKCPVCQHDQNDPEEKKHPHLIPIDIGTIFFILLGQRTQLLLNSAIL